MPAARACPDIKTSFLVISNETILGVSLVPIITTLVSSGMEMLRVFSNQDQLVFLLVLSVHRLRLTDHT